MSTQSCSNDDLKALILTQAKNIENLTLNVHHLTLKVDDLTLKVDHLSSTILEIKDIKTNAPIKDLDLQRRVTATPEHDEQRHVADSSSSDDEEDPKNQASSDSAESEDDIDIRATLGLFGVNEKQMPEEDAKKILDNVSFITDEIKYPDELCTTLLEKSVFTEYTAERILNDYDEGRDKACESLLSRLLECRGSYDLFIYCLKELEYDDVIKTLETGLFEFLESDSDSEKNDKERDKRIQVIMQNAEKRIKSGLKGMQKGLSSENFDKINMYKLRVGKTIKEPGELSKKLYEKSVFSKKDKRAVEALDSKNKKKTTKAILYDVLNSGDCYNQFLSGLREMGYHHVVERLEHGDDRDDSTERPKVKLRGRMPAFDLNKIQNNFIFVRDNIEDPIELGNKLMEKSVFDMDDKEELMKVFKEGKREACDKLVTMLIDCNGCYDRFILCLEQLGYHDIVRKLETDPSATRGRRESIKDLEARIESITNQAEKRIKSGRKGKQRGKMPKEDEDKIRRNLSFLKDNLREPGKLSDKLLESYVFDANDRKSVQTSEKEGKIQTTTKLLDILSNSGDCYPNFLTSLKELGYYQVIDRLEPRETEMQVNKPSDDGTEREKSKISEEEKMVIKDILESSTEEECLDRIRKLLQTKVDKEVFWRLFRYDYDTDTCLMKIIKKGWNKVFECLLDYVGDVNCLNGYQENVLLIFLKCYDSIHSDTRSPPTKDMADTMIQNVKLLVEKGISIHSRDPKGNTPLLLAAVSDLDGVITYLLDCGASPCDVNNDKENLLHCLFKFSIITYEKIVIVIKLGKRLKDLDTADIHGRTPLHYICNFFKKEMDEVRHLRFYPHPILESEVSNDVDEYEDRHQGVCILLEKGCDVNKQDENGMTPLMCIVCSVVENDTALQIVGSLLEHGADIDAENKDGKTALMMAQRFQKIKIIDLLKR